MKIEQLPHSKVICRECQRVAVWLIETEKRHFLAFCRFHMVVLKAQLNDLELSDGHTHRNHSA